MSECRGQSTTPLPLVTQREQKTLVEDQPRDLSALCPGAGLWSDAPVPAGLPQAIGPTDLFPHGAYPAVCTHQTTSSTVCLRDSSLSIRVYCLLTQAVITLSVLRTTSGNSALQNKALRKKQNKILHSLPWNDTLISSSSPTSTCDCHLCCVPCRSHWGQSWLKKVPPSLSHFLLTPYLP